MTGGFVKLHRCALDSWLWKLPAEQFKVALTVLVSANWRDGVAVSGGRRVDVPRGSMVTTLDDLAAKSGVTVRTCRTALKNLANLEFLTSTSTNKFRVISVVNYDSYQARDDDSDKHSVTQLPGNCQATDKQVTINCQAYYKEEEDQEREEGEEQEEHIAPAGAGHHHAQPGLFAESAQEPRKTAVVDRDTGPVENASPAPAGGLTKATVIAELVHGTDDERRAAASRGRQGQWGRELQRRRMAIGITADELAKFLSVSGRRITAWEKGTATPGPEEQQQCDGRLADIEQGLLMRAEAATDELREWSRKNYKADSQHARAAALQAWRWGWDVERMRCVVRVICHRLHDFKDGAHLVPSTVFAKQKLKDAAEQLDAGAVPHNGRQTLKGAALLDQWGEVAADIRRDEEQRRQLQ